MTQRRHRILVFAIAILAWAGTGSGLAQDKPRARDLGVPFDGTPGPLNAITDVAGIEVGHATRIEGSGPLVVGEGPVRTGVTAIWPRGKDDLTPVFAAWFALNGNGEMTGTTWVKESGLLDGPFMITNTLSVGVVHHAVIRWGVQRSEGFNGIAYPGPIAALPVVAETWDGGLNDILGQHVTEEDAFAAMAAASGGPVTEGAVGGGTGMVCNDFKGGIGTSSRVIEVAGAPYTLGVLVQCNYGNRDQLRVAGVPVGREIIDLMPGRPDGQSAWASASAPGAPGGTAVSGDTAVSLRSRQSMPVEASPDDLGSIIVLVATDAPLLPYQLERLARRVSMGLARNGSVSGNGSGDIFMALSTANREAAATGRGHSGLQMVANADMGRLFAATIEATEESIINAMVAAETMTGANDITVHALPHDRLRDVLRKHNRLVQ